MPLVFAAVMPHGGALVPGVDDGSPHGSPLLTKAMREAAESAADARLDALIVADPHGIGFEGAHSITAALSAKGSLGPHEMEVELDEELATGILDAAIEASIPCVGVTTDVGPLPLEWGTFVPAWFLREAGALPPLVMICPTRSRSFDSLAALGEAIGKLAEQDPRRIGFIASADNAHAHQEDGPYGFHPSAKRFDELVVKLTEEELFEEYLTFDETLLEEALPDSPWQLAILAGLFRVIPFRTRTVTYECPSYFGMMVSTFDRLDDEAVRTRRS